MSLTRKTKATTTELLSIAYQLNGVREGVATATLDEALTVAADEPAREILQRFCAACEGAAAVSRQLLETMAERRNEESANAN